MGFHPLRGPNADDFGVRFPPLSEAYDLELRQRAHRLWNEIPRTSSSRQLREGVYAFVSGPSYETRAECRMLHQLGADLVGMSTVPEIIVARHSGIKILAFSLVTNSAVLEQVPRGNDAALQNMEAEELQAYLSKGKANHEEVLEAGREAAKDMQVSPEHDETEFVPVGAKVFADIGPENRVDFVRGASSLLIGGRPLCLERIVESLFPTRLFRLNIAVLALESPCLLLSC